MFSKDCLYITLQHLRTVGGQNKYHWALFTSEDSPPSGILLHATDANRKPLDLYSEVRRVSDPLRSGSMVVILKITDSPGLNALKKCASSIRLMDPAYLPRGESRWTCRVWVKEVLNSLHKNGYIELPSGIDAIEEWCQYVADRHIHFKGRAKIFNDLSWMSTDSSSRDTLSDADARGTGGRYYGPSPMVIDSTSRPYYGPSPMAIDSTGGRYYGPSPMVTETHHYPSGRR
ncbi:hypothetical protein F5Y06DRAFT_263136 [Hypoxylon sp. FL0890]|nr:hypothetical protein F5Y06DRAFT_263136 [Hypoxylon sp. FL0890]